MVERKLISEGIEITHTGLFFPKQVEQLVTDALKKFSYDIHTTNHFIQSTEEHKTHTTKFLCKKDLTEFDYITLTVSCSFANMIPVMVQKQEFETTAQKGMVKISFTALLEGKREGVFGKSRGGLTNKGQYIKYFFHILFSKFFKKSQYEQVDASVEDEIREMQDDISIVLKKQKLVEVKNA
ncbi:MAG: hypothetical protein ACMXYA_01110 [Candidatus Woesearchaeota archaeon]